MRHSCPLVGCGEGRGLYGVELYAAVRLAVVEEGLSHREAGRRFGIDRRTVKKMLSYSAPPGYRRSKPVRRPKLEGFTGIIDAILEADRAPDVPRKQRHTVHRIFERLRDEHGFTGGYTIVKDYVRSQRQSTREAFIPLHHPPGHAQVDFGEAVVEIGGQREKVAFFCLILPHSDRVVREGVSEGDDGSPSSTAMSAPSPSSAGFRARSSMTTRRLRWRGSWATGSAPQHPGVHASTVAPPVPRPLRTAGQGQRQVEGFISQLPRFVVTGRAQRGKRGRYRRCRRVRWTSLCTW